MSDETQDQGKEQQASPAGTAVVEPEGGEEAPPPKLNQTVDIKDAGPCKKHVKVSVAREDIDKRLNDKFSEMMPEASLPGYRPGKAPRKLIEKKFFKDVSEQLKAEILLQSLEQLAEDHQLNPIAQPDLDPFKVELPQSGPLEYEFDVEVAPEFELPPYKGLKLKRPVRELKEAEVELAQKRFLARYGTLVPKEGPAEMEDYVVADVVFSHGGQELSRLKEITLKVDPQLAFKDGTIADFGQKMQGVLAGEERTCQLGFSPSVSNPSLRGQSAVATFQVKEVKRNRPPELTETFLNSLGVQTPEQLREKIRSVLERQLEYEQRQAARQQVLEQITASAGWDLPRDLLARQARRLLQRRVLEMRSSGFSEDEIRRRSTLLQQDAMANTARALKEHFVLQKIADVEKIEVTDQDVEFEIDTMAAQSDETPRRVRARLEREDLMESLMTEILERKALDLVLNSAEYEDVPLEAAAPPGVEAVEQQTVPGQEPEAGTGEPSPSA